MTTPDEPRPDPRPDPRPEPYAAEPYAAELDALLGAWAAASALTGAGAADLLATIVADRVVTLDPRWWTRHNRRLAGRLARASRPPLVAAHRAA